MLELLDLSVSFKTMGKTLPVVRRMSLTLGEGECVGLVGESGSGKSVTAKAIMGLIRSSNVSLSGQIKFLGRDLISLSEPEFEKIRGKDIAMIFQEPMTALNPVLSVFEQVAEPLRVHSRGMGRSELEKHVFNTFERVGLVFGKEAFKLYPHEISGGMRQRVMIAMSIILRPKILIADEPTTALDVTVQSQILKLLRELQKEMRMSVLLVSHDLAVISEMTRRLYVMYAGQAVEVGETRSILTSRTHPYTEGLFQSIPNLEAKQHRLRALSGSLPSPGNLPRGCSFAERCPKRVALCEQEEPRLALKKTGQFASCFEVD